MECKSLWDQRPFPIEIELIDTLWNVNEAAIINLSDYSIELIDTLWNVNVKTLQNQANRLRELIDTLWNVNLPGCRGVCAGSRN